MRLILASASPQRKTLLAGLGVPFDVIPSVFNETGCSERDPPKRASILARRKAEDVHAKHSGACVIGCDTLVVASDGTLLEKPTNANDAERMLRLQSGQISIVHSAICVRSPRGMHEGIASSHVHFKKLSEQEIAWWISIGEWKDRSGAFQIDGRGQLMIERIEGDWTGIVGLPIFSLGELMEKVGIKWKTENSCLPDRQA
ncbi:septum formation protein Maf [Candidatus Peribacteria bacterium]|nr:septum formation protein Maf [Candidatus Peribacteria bacterium]